MSSTELHYGKLIKVQFEQDSIEQWAKDKCIELQNGSDELQEYDTYLKDLLHYHAWNHKELEDKYFVINNTLYELINHIEHDECDYAEMAIQNSDGSIDFVAQFYNGGTCLSEVLEDIIDNSTITSNSAPSVDVNRAVDWKTFELTLISNFIARLGPHGEPMGHVENAIKYAKKYTKILKKIYG